MIVQTGDKSQHILEETEATNEEELRSLVKDNPDLLPIEEFGLNGPVMVVGRETTLPSGAVDLICVTANGDLLVVEFKTGPQNSDFRHFPCTSGRCNFKRHEFCNPLKRRQNLKISFSKHSHRGFESSSKIESCQRKRLQKRFFFLAILS